MRFGAKLLFIVSLAIAFAGCTGDKTGTADNGTTPGGPTKSGGDSGEKPLVYFSQANSADPWRQVQDAETKDAAAKQANLFTFEETTAGDDPNKQIDQIETELIKKPKAMLVSPAKVAVQKAVEEAHDQGVFVVVSDRSLTGDKWDCYVGGDNHAIGFEAGQYMGKKLNGKGIVLMIQGIADAIPTKERAGGFMDAMKQFPGIKIIAGDNCDYQRDKAETYMENWLQRKLPFDAVYAHNDEMAIGAYMAMEAAKTPKKVIVGIDGCQKEVVQMIKDGKLDATFSYPDPGPKGIQIIAEALNGKKPASKKVLLPTVMVTKETADAYSAAHPNLH